MSYRDEKEIIKLSVDYLRKVGIEEEAIDELVDKFDIFENLFCSQIYARNKFRAYFYHDRTINFHSSTMIKTVNKVFGHKMISKPNNSFRIRINNGDGTSSIFNAINDIYQKCYVNYELMDTPNLPRFDLPNKFLEMMIYIKNNCYIYSSYDFTNNASVVFTIHINHKNSLGEFINLLINIGLKTCDCVYSYEDMNIFISNSIDITPMSINHWCNICQTHRYMYSYGGFETERHGLCEYDTPFCKTVDGDLLMVANEIVLPGNPITFSLYDTNHDDEDDYVLLTDNYIPGKVKSAANRAISQ